MMVPVTVATLSRVGERKLVVAKPVLLVVKLGVMAMPAVAEKLIN